MTVGRGAVFRKSFAMHCEGRKALLFVTKNGRRFPRSILATAPVVTYIARQRFNGHETRYSGHTRYLRHLSEAMHHLVA